MNDPQSKRGLSLRVWLIWLTVIGALFGLLGRWWFRAPGWFAVTIFGLLIVLPYLLASSVLLRVGVKEKRTRLTLCGLAMLVGPLVGWPLAMMAGARANGGPRALAAMSTSELLTQELPQKVSEPWVWQELESRLSAGKLKQTDVDAAIAELAKHMRAAQPTGWQSPLSWQKGFIEQANASGKLSKSTLISLCDAFFAVKPELKLKQRVLAGGEKLPLAVSLNVNSWADHSGLPVRLVWWPEEVRLDGEPLAKGEDGGLFSTEGALSTQALNGGFVAPQTLWRSDRLVARPLTEGKHTVTVEIAYAYIDVAKLIGLPEGCLDSSMWPVPVKKWRQTETIEIEVAPADGPTIALITSPEHDPLRTEAIKIGRAVLQVVGPGQSRLILPGLKLSPTSIPLAFDVTAIIGDERLPLGGMAATATFGTSSGGGEAILPTPGPEVVTFGLLLVPKPELLESCPGVKGIWGKRVELRGLELERLDLEAITTSEAGTESEP